MKNHDLPYLGEEETISLTDLRDNLTTIATWAQLGRRYIITKNNRPIIVVQAIIDKKGAK